MNSLNGVRQDCLLRVLGRADHDVRRSVATFVDTLAHGFLTQATLRKADASRAKKALCKAYKAAFVANILAGQHRQLNLSDHEPFLRASLKENGTAITDHRFKTATGDVLRAAREQLEVLGEGACSDFSPNTTESWTDDAG